MKAILTTLTALILFAPLAKADDTFDLKASIDRGKAIYMQTCIVCHQPTGLGHCPAPFRLSPARSTRKAIPAG